MKPSIIGLEQGKGLRNTLAAATLFMGGAAIALSGGGEKPAPITEQPNAVEKVVGKQEVPSDVGVITVGNKTPGTGAFAQEYAAPGKYDAVKKAADLQEAHDADGFQIGDKVLVNAADLSSDYKIEPSMQPAQLYNPNAEGMVEIPVVVPNIDEQK